MDEDSDSFEELDDEEYDPSYNTRSQRKRRQSSKSTKSPRKRNSRSIAPNQTPASVEYTVDDDALIAQEEDEAFLFDTVGGDNDEESVTKASAHKDDWEESDFIFRQEQLSPESKQNQETTFGTHVCRNSWENLFEYQREGCKWMFSLFREGVGGILADEMGLGKTAQVAVHFGSLGKMNHILNERRQSMFLVVCPATVLVHWLKEMHRWAPDMRTGILHTISVTGREMLSLSPENLTQVLRNIRRSPISQGVTVITSYETMRRSVAALSSIEWTAVCLDEGHKIRNPEAAITLACKTLPAFHRLILSGTPIQNSLVELWCLFDFIYPGKLGNRHVFEEEFAYPIRIGAYAHATKLQYEVAIRCAGTLQRLVKPYLLRRKKEDLQAVAKLPPKTEQVLFCPISKRQRVIYEQILQSDEVQKVIARKIPAFRAINQLRKLCNHPALVYQDGAIQWAAVKDTRLQQRLQEEVLAEKKRQYQEDQAYNGNATSHGNDSEDEEFMLQYRLSSQGTVLHPSLKNQRRNENVSIHQHLVWSDSGKLLVLSKILPIWQREGHKVLVFCQTTSMLHLIEQMILNMHFTYLRLDGQTPIGKRDGLISEFNANESIFLMLLTTRTGGVGISLTAANRIVLFDPDWNPMTDIQARERAWRLGQRREVVIYRLITKGTIEEKIYHRQIFKLLMSHRVLDDPKQKNLFSKSQMQDLFDLAPEVTGADIAEAHQEHVANQTATGIKPFYVENRPGASGHTGFAGKELPMAGQVSIWEVENADEYNDHIAHMAGFGSLTTGNDDHSHQDTTVDTNNNSSSTSDVHENARSQGALRTSNIINNIFSNSSNNSDHPNLGLEEAFHIETITAEKQREEAEVYNMLLDIHGGPPTHLDDDEQDHDNEDDGGDALTRHFRAINRQQLRTPQSNTSTNNNNSSNNNNNNSNSSKKASTNNTPTEHQAHDRKLLRALFDNEAIVSIYSHDYLEPTKNNASMSKRAKEEAQQLARQADRRAARAFQSLQSSSTVYQPTSSSSSGDISHTSNPHHHPHQHHPHHHHPDQHSDVLSRYFGSVQANATEAGHASSSSSLLSAIRQRENEACPAVSLTNDTVAESTAPLVAGGIEEQLKQRLVTLFRSSVSHATTTTAVAATPSSPYTLSTNQILRHFRDLGDQYAPLFRKLLRSVAVLRNGAWVLRDKFK